MAGALFVVQHTQQFPISAAVAKSRRGPFRRRARVVADPRDRPVTSGTAGQAWFVQKPPIDNTKPGEFKVSTIGKPVHAPRRILPVIFKVIDRTALFVAYAVFLAVLPVGAIGLFSHTV